MVVLDQSLTLDTFCLETVHVLGVKQCAYWDSLSWLWSTDFQDVALHVQPGQLTRGERTRR